MERTDALVAPGARALLSGREVYVRQQRELAELFGFETRNKYGLYGPDKQPLGFAAEQGKGFLGAIFRQLLGHWRTFDITFFGPDREPLFIAHHPFRFFFQRLEVRLPDGRPIGALQQRFAFLSKQFEVISASGRTLLTMRSGLFSPWTFPFFKAGTEAAVIEKRWSGALTELFTDKDNFRVRFTSALTDDERMLVLAAAVFVDLQYFEAKANME